MATTETFNFRKTPQYTITNKESLQPICNTSLLENSTEYNLGIKLIFPKDQTSYQNELNENEGEHITIDIDPTSYVSGFAGTIQNCLVDTLLISGSDTSHPERGTDLENDALESYITNNDTLVHSCNFAAERVKNFQNGYLSTNYIVEYKTEDNLDRSESDQTKIWVEDSTRIVSPTIESYKLTPQIYKLDVATLQAQFTSSDGETIGIAYDSSLIDGSIN